MLRQITLNLGQGFSITTSEDRSNIKIFMLKDQEIIGESHLITDHVDVSCVSHIQLKEEFIHYKIRNNVDLGEAFVKFNIKFPTIVRKLEFCFFLNVSENLKTIVTKHHFDRGEDSKIKDEIMICHRIVLPERKPILANAYIKKSIEQEELQKLLPFLKETAYWQSHLTLDRLEILVANSRCFSVFSERGEMIGFCRVLTDNHSFASLWDVVVDESHRNQGIGTALMFSVFTDEQLSTINNWVIYTDTARPFYQKFGFISESNIPDRTLMHKLRLQESPPLYMTSLIKSIPKDQNIYLDEEKAFAFLFGEQGKRAHLSAFWQRISVSKENQKKEDSEYSHRYSS